MSKLKSIIFLIVFGSVEAIFWLQHSSYRKLQRENEVLRGDLAELKRFQEVREPVAVGGSLTKEQLDELSELRSEAARLREQTNQIGGLIDANQNLAESLKEMKALRTNKKKGPEDALPQDIHPRNSWAFRGYVTPEATMESLIWAKANKDKARFLEGFAPEEQAKMQKTMDRENPADTINFTEFRILDRRQISDDEVVLTFYLEGIDANGEKIVDDGHPVFKRINGGWKLGGSPPPDN